MIWIWYTWLAFFGLIAGIVVSSLIGASLLRSALLGFAGGLVMVTLWNALGSAPPPCLSNSKGLDILRAYNLDCLKSNEPLLPLLFK